MNDSMVALCTLTEFTSKRNTHVWFSVLMYAYSVIMYVYQSTQHSIVYTYIHAVNEYI